MFWCSSSHVVAFPFLVENSGPHFSASLIGFNRNPPKKTTISNVRSNHIMDSNWDIWIRYQKRLSWVVVRMNILHNKVPTNGMWFKRIYSDFSECFTMGVKRAHLDAHDIVLWSSFWGLSSEWQRWDLHLTNPEKSDPWRSLGDVLSYEVAQMDHYFPSIQFAPTIQPISRMLPTFLQPKKETL